MEWDPRATEAIAEETCGLRPLWLRIANFFGRTLDVLRRLPPGQLVVWRIEHWGLDTPFDRVPASVGLDPATYVDDLLNLGHTVMPYTYTAPAREALKDDVPSLPDLDVVPVALKPPVLGAGRHATRAKFGISPAAIVLGGGGLLHPAKGLNEIATSFLRAGLGPDVHLLMSVVDEEGAGAVEQRQEWLAEAGLATSANLHVKASGYGGWEWMCDFYHAVDVVLINSVSDSWGRMVSEPLGLGVPVIVRRARCGTNYIDADVVLVDGFTDLGSDSFWSCVGLARSRAPQLAASGHQRCGQPVVRRRFLSILRSRTPPGRLDEFDRLAGAPESLAALDAALDH